MARYIFITGGVVSSLGKGLASAALGALLQARGYKVRLRKLDPYLNLDPGTMSPYQHGEVFVTDDGAETDLDLGHYERFTGRPASRQDNITAGRIYQEILAKELRSIGIQPDILLCRTDRAIPKEERRKVALFCNVRESAVIEAQDVDNIYAVPEAYHAAGFDREVLAAFGIESAPVPDLATWRLINERIRSPEGDVTIAIVGKYTGMKDAYKSLIEALSHCGIANKVKVNLDWIESEIFEKEDPAPFLEHVNGILVPGGFGQRF